MAALRDWSSPGRRADLVAAAWLAGETNVSLLAEAARTSRPTVYADLRSRGIDPDHRPKEPAMPAATAPVVIDGIDGTSFSNVQEAVDRFVEQYPGADEAAVKSEIARTFPIFQAVYRYNRLRDLLVLEDAARRDRDRALHLVEVRWEALGTAAHWLAAHHAYVVAVDDARTAIRAWAQTAEDANAPGWFSGDEIAVYEERILAANHPPLERPTPDPAAVADEMLATLDRTHAHRLDLAAATLNRTATP